jgi:hypothetical protein
VMGDVVVCACCGANDGEKEYAGDVGTYAGGARAYADVGIYAGGGAGASPGEIGEYAGESGE